MKSRGRKYGQNVRKSLSVMKTFSKSKLPNGPRRQFYYLGFLTLNQTHSPPITQGARHCGKHPGGKPRVWECPQRAALSCTSWRKFSQRKKPAMADPQQNDSKTGKNRSREVQSGLLMSGETWWKRADLSDLKTLENQWGAMAIGGPTRAGHRGQNRSSMSGGHSRDHSSHLPLNLQLVQHQP